MTVKVTKINYILVGQSKLIPGKDPITLAPGETIRVGVHIYNSGWLAAQPKDVFIGIAPEWGGKWMEQRVGSTGYLWPKDDEDMEFQFRIPSNLQKGSYWLGARTEEEAGYATKVAVAVEPPITPGMGRIEVWSYPAGADVYIDGVKVGRTPYAKDVAPGYHEVKVEKGGYEVKKIIGAEVVGDAARVNIIPGARARVTFILEPKEALWKSAWVWGLAGLGIGAALALKKGEQIKPYVQKAVEKARPYVEKVRERARAYIR